MRAHLKKVLNYFILAVILIILTFAVISYLNKKPIVTSFEACVGAGYPVMESYPRQCRADGQNFIEDIGNELEKADLIRIDYPRPNQIIASPLEITGVARGAWYFEASFPVELRDANDNLIIQTHAEAQADWMTTEFVPYRLTMEFAIPPTATGTLILRKDNPSGLPEHEDALIVPVKF